MRISLSIVSSLVENNREQMRQRANKAESPHRHAKGPVTHAKRVHLSARISKRLSIHTFSLVKCLAEPFHA